MKLKALTFPVLLLTIGFWHALRDTESSPEHFLDDDLAKCHNTTQEFVNLADEEFLAAHKDPIPFDFQDPGEMITFPVSGGKDANAYLVKSNVPSDTYLFVIHEWYGLNNYVKNEAAKFSTRFNEMNVLALDLYDGKVAETSDKARELMQAAKTARIIDIINAAQAYVGADAEIFTVGWCFGGGWSLQTAIELGDQAKGAVMFYGMPEKDPERLQKLQCDVLAFFGTEDNWITQEVAREFEKNMAKIDPELSTYSYEANHGFANPSNPAFNEDAASKAYKNMFDFIQARR